MGIMKVFVIANQKGGVGKSTIACNLAVNFSVKNNNVLLIDTDIQESSISFRALRQSDDIKSISIKTPTIHKDIKSFENFDIVVIDAGGRDNGVLRSAILSAAHGILIVPTLPSVYDLWATEDTLKIIQDARVYQNIKSYILINQVIKANIVKETEEALNELIVKYEMKLLNTSIFSRVVYRNSIKEGKGAIEMADKKAKEEMEQLTIELSNITKIS
jgi:chromosome partitioning protein